MKSVISAGALSVADLAISILFVDCGSPLDLSSILICDAPIFVFFGFCSVCLAERFARFTGPIFRGGYVSDATPALIFVALGFLFLILPPLGLLWRFISSPGAI